VPQFEFGFSHDEMLIAARFRNNRAAMLRQNPHGNGVIEKWAGAEPAAAQ